MLERMLGRFEGQSETGSPVFDHSVIGPPQYVRAPQ
jgi:hypothetical protein